MLAGTSPSPDPGGIGLVNDFEIIVKNNIKFRIRIFIKVLVFIRYHLPLILQNIFAR